MDRADAIGLTLRTDSQDAWIFQSPLPDTVLASTDFQLGLPRCDNRLVEILYQHQYIIANPVFHIHAIEIQEGKRVPLHHGNDTGDNGGKYSSILYGMKNSVLGIGRNAFITDSFHI